MHLSELSLVNQTPDAPSASYRASSRRRHASLPSILDVHAPILSELSLSSIRSNVMSERNGGSRASCISSNTTGIDIDRDLGINTSSTALDHSNKQPTHNNPSSGTLSVRTTRRHRRRERRRTETYTGTSLSPVAARNASKCIRASPARSSPWGSSKCTRTSPHVAVLRRQFFGSARKVLWQHCGMFAAFHNAAAILFLDAADFFSRPWDSAS